MFSFHKIEIVHWDWWERFTLPLDANIVTVVGPNGSGKTTLLDALRTLLAINCSQGRDYKRYVRRADRPYAWLRATVSNPKRSNGQLAFWPILDPIVTLFCRIRKKGGDWERSYGIGAGDVPVEIAETSEAVTWVGVRQYESQLENAGLTRAIKRVLALDQGHTDKLCEYSPRQLLDLVFDVFGDQEVLDNYQKAREDQLACARELDELKTQLARLHTQLQASEADVHSFREYERLLNELADLTGQWLPRLQLAELLDALRGGRAQLLGKRREVADVDAQLAAHAAEHAALLREREETESAEADSRVRMESLQQQERQIERPLGKAQAVLEQRKRLLERLERQSGGLDTEAALREQEKLGRRRYELQGQLDTVDREIGELQSRIAALDSGRRPEPREVTAFAQALSDAGIAHRMLGDIVEITDDSWQLAVESVLAGVRHLVLLEKPGDRAAAWKLGEQQRYRHYVVHERAPAPRPQRGSLLECVRFHADPPVWLAKLLDGIQRVETTEEGTRLPEGQSWITPRAYQRERRGGRDISVSDVHFGRNAVADAHRRVEELCDQREGLREALALTTRKLTDVQSVLAGVDATREIAARAPEFETAEAEVTRLAEELETIGSARAAAAARYYAMSQALHALTSRHDRAEEALQKSRTRQRHLNVELDQSRRAHAGHVLEWRRLRRGKPTVWRTASAMSEARTRYETTGAVEREIERLHRRKDDGRWNTDANCVAIRDKLDAEHRQLESRIGDQDVHLERARSSTDRARSQYVNVLRATVRRYAQNLRNLGALAGIDVEVQPPQLNNDDLTLSQARLEVQFNFDQKGMIGLNDGEASGGQQVMKSMILLVGLLMDEDQSGGFVFIDEPFAHLDIFNIDKVGAFLQATRAQYIVTTPNTHNVNVFKPSGLTLVTQKKRGATKYAPPIAFLRRDTAGA
ncbi:MAG: AAA family ATPase [Solimonas sp.]